MFMFILIPFQSSRGGGRQQPDDEAANARTRELTHTRPRAQNTRTQQYRHTHVGGTQSVWRTGQLLLALSTNPQRKTRAHTSTPRHLLVCVFRVWCACVCVCGSTPPAHERATTNKQPNARARERTRGFSVALGSDFVERRNSASRVPARTSGANCFYGTCTGAAGFHAFLSPAGRRLLLGALRCPVPAPEKQLVSTQTERLEMHTQCTHVYVRCSRATILFL